MKNCVRQVGEHRPIWFVPAVASPEAIIKVVTSIISTIALGSGASGRAIATPADGRLFLLRGVLAARFHVGVYLTGVEAADEVIALTPRGI